MQNIFPSCNSVAKKSLSISVPYDVLNGFADTRFTVKSSNWKVSGPISLFLFITMHLRRFLVRPQYYADQYVFYVAASWMTTQICCIYFVI